MYETDQLMDHQIKVCTRKSLKCVQKINKISMNIYYLFFIHRKKSYLCLARHLALVL